MKKRCTLFAYGICLLAVFGFQSELSGECTYSSLTLDQVIQNTDNTYNITMTFCASGGYDNCTDVTGAFGFLLEGGAAILNFPSSLTSPQTGATYYGFMYNNSVDSLIYFDYGQNTWWTCVHSLADCGPFQAICKTITITTDILPSKITCGGMEGMGVLVAPYSCTGPNLEIYPDPNYPPPTPCQTFTLIADAGADQDVLYSYNNSECTSLTASFSGNYTAPLSYQWSNGNTTATIAVCPNTTTSYSVTITDGEGCTATDDVTINVTDISCGNGKIFMCSPNGSKTRCIRDNQVDGKLANGWTLGPCNQNSNRMVNDLPLIAIQTNLNDKFITLKSRYDEDQEITLHIYNLSGQLLISEYHPVRIDSDTWQVNTGILNSGIYVMAVFDDQGLLSSEKFYKR